MIEGAKALPAPVKETAVAVFAALAEAEAATHGVTVDEVGRDDADGWPPPHS